MKKYLKFVFSIVMLLALTGCVKYNMNMEVKSNKSVDLELIYAMDMSFMNGIGGSSDELTLEETESDSGVKEDDYNFLKQHGFTVEAYKEETENKKYSGVKIKKTYNSIDDITKENDKEIDINKVLGEEETFDDSQFYSKKGNMYKANLVFDFTSGDSNSETENGEEEITGIDTSAISNSFEMKYTIKLPVKATSNNATEVSEDGKTLTWTLKNGVKNNVMYTFELNDGLFALNTNTLLLIGLGIGLIVIIIIVILIGNKNKNKDKKTTENTEVINTPAGPINISETQNVQTNEINNNENQTIPTEPVTEEPQVEPLKQPEPTTLNDVTPAFNAEEINQSVQPNQNNNQNNM